MTQLNRLSLALPLGALLLAGCTTMIPPYSRPAAPVPEAWPGTAAQAETPRPGEKPSAAPLEWQEVFGDVRLQQLISLALENNRDLRVAALNIERSRALYQIRGADLWPKVDGSAGAGWQRIPEDLSGSGRAMTVDQYSVALGVSAYELDFFGRVQSLKAQALEQFLATEQARRSIRLSLVAQVANGYLTLAGDRERLQLAQQTLASQEASYQLTKSRFAAGVATGLALSQAQSSVEAARVDIARYTALAAQDENALSQVVGAPLPAELLPPDLGASLSAVREVSAGLPSEVLLQRPDILQAENLLKGVNANIGAARAAFFPRITLISSVGFGSDQLSSLFSGGNFAWNFAPRLSLPLFDGGGNAANLKVAEVDRDIAVAQYEKAIQTAFREVADGLAQRGTIADQLTAQEALIAATTDSLRLSQARFDQGVDSYLSVLDSQRALYSAQQNLISARLARLTNLVTLYKALGGGNR